MYAVITPQGIAIVHTPLAAATLAEANDGHVERIL